MVIADEIQKQNNVRMQMTVEVDGIVGEVW